MMTSITPEPAALRLLSVDWDYYAGSAPLVFDSPLWGSPDLAYHRHGRWCDLARKRGGSDYQVLAQDFPLLGDPWALAAYAGVPCFAAASHDRAWFWLQDQIQKWHDQNCNAGAQQPSIAVYNLDSHHDLYSSSGNPQRLRPGNWAGLALQAGLIQHYHCLYPSWHQDVAVAEGFDLARTTAECQPHLAEVWPRVHLSRTDRLPTNIDGLLLVQSASWSNPLYDEVWQQLLSLLQAELIEDIPLRPFRAGL